MSEAIELEGVKELLTELEAQQKTAKTEPSFEQVPKGTEYFQLGNSLGKFVIKAEEERNSNHDRQNLKRNNYFRSRERAEEVLDKVNIFLEAERLRFKYCPNYFPDWGDRRAKWYLVYDTKTNLYKVDHTETDKFVGFTYFPSEALACLACKELNQTKGR